MVWAQDCAPPAIHEKVQIGHVVDGDTLRLKDGRRLRLAGVNAPELANDGNPEQPLARASRAAVVAFIAGTEFVQLSFESRRADRYGRILAHVTHPSGRSLESHLVREGLAVPFAVAPDLLLADCLRRLADQARQAGRGIWQTSYWAPLPATQLDNAESAFRIVCGRVAKVDAGRDVYLELEGSLAIHIARDQLKHFDQQQLRESLGRTVEVVGWLIDRRTQTAVIKRGFKPWLIRAQAPSNLRWDGACPS